MASTTNPFSCALFLIVLAFLCVGHFQHVKATSLSPVIVNGLSWNFYDSSCPKLESIVRKQLKKVFDDDIGLAAALLRLHFHDCFVKGCDASVLLDGSASGPSEQSAIPNLTLRPEAFETINDLRRRVHKRCGRVVSCADIVSLAARDAVYLSGGPDYDVPLGRRDGVVFATGQDILDLPAPFSNASVLLSAFAKKNLDAVDLVALSGGHTIGRAHCTSFTDRLYPTQDPVMDKSFANKLKITCPTSNSTNTTMLDVRSPNEFDHRYFIDLMNRQGVFTSDQDLYTNKRTRDIVTSFALDKTLFFERYVDAITKMGQLSVLTGAQGEIRANCSARNSDKLLISSVVDGEEAGLLEI